VQQHGGYALQVSRRGFRGSTNADAVFYNYEFFSDWQKDAVNNDPYTATNDSRIFKMMPRGNRGKNPGVRQFFPRLLCLAPTPDSLAPIYSSRALSQNTCASIFPLRSLKRTLLAYGPRLPGRQSGGDGLGKVMPKKFRLNSAGQSSVADALFFSRSRRASRFFLLVFGTNYGSGLQAQTEKEQFREYVSSATKVILYSSTPRDSTCNLDDCLPASSSPPQEIDF